MVRLVHAPAILRRAFFVGVWLAVGSVQAGPPPTNSSRTPPAYLQLGKMDQEEGRRALEAFRGAGIPGQYYLEFELRVMPRRGEERIVPGQLWGARNEQGAVTRCAVSDGDGGDRRLLLQNGEQAKVWCTDLKGAAAGQVRIVDSFEPLIPGVELTAFDLQMPYIYWTDAVLERLVSIRSRPTHVFLFRPAAAWAAEHPDVSGVRTYLDTQFNVPVQTEVLGRDGRVVRTLSLVDLKKVGDQYIPKSIDLRNEHTRDKVRFQVLGAALNLNLPPAVFDPSHLVDPVAPPPAGKIIR
jgi:hypothetical protein